MKKLKILLVGNYKPDKQESMQRFADLLVDALRPHGHEVKIIRPPVVFNRSQAGFEEKGKWWGYIDKFLVFPFILKKAARSAEIIHICDHSNAYYINFISNQPHIINCHDVIAIRAALDPSNQNIKRSGKILQKIILQGLKKANCFACISENSKRELLEITGVADHQAAVIYMGINYPFKRMDVDEAKSILSTLKQTTGADDALSSGFILHIGGNQPYKNRMGVLRIYQHFCSLEGNHLKLRLILAGKPWSDEMRSFVFENGMQESVVEIAESSNEQIQALYSLAQVFIFPSLAEGFGWPVIEAQACGCPVLTSNFAPLTEIGGDAALYCDPRDEKEVARQLNTLLNEDEIARKTRISAGLENVKRFTPQKMIEGYLSLYETAIKTHASNHQ